jgi:hypothetical protein
MGARPGARKPCGMGLFNRKKKPERDLRACPRCAQLVDQAADECPMCGWDLREAYRPAAESA